MTMNKPDSAQTLLFFFENSVNAASWLTPADKAQIHVARMLCKELDSAEDYKTIAELSRILTEVLKHLGLNVAGRTGKAEAKLEVNPLDEIKAKAGQRKATPRSKATKSAKPRK